jgi:hypothetical protein
MRRKGVISSGRPPIAAGFTRRISSAAPDADADNKQAIAKIDPS